MDPELEGAGYMMSKTNIVAVTEVFAEDEEIKLTMSNLQEKESDVQEELYKEAYDLIDYDEIEYSGIRPPAIDAWLKVHKVPLSQATSLRLSHYRTPWGNHGERNGLRLEGTFWQPGGHYFTWAGEFFKTRCYVFGPVQEVFTVDFIHFKHGGPESTIEAGDAYAGKGRLAYYNGKLKNLLGLNQSSGVQTDLLTGAKNMVFTESR